MHVLHPLLNQYNGRVVSVLDILRSLVEKAANQFSYFSLPAEAAGQEVACTSSKVHPDQLHIAL